MTKKQLTKLKIKSVIDTIIFWFWYVITAYQGSEMILAIHDKSGHVFANVLFFLLSVAWLVFYVYKREKSIKEYKDAKSQSEI